MTARRRGVRLLLGVLFSALLFAAKSAHAQAEPPNVERSAQFEWDVDRRLLYLNIGFRDLIDTEVKNKLTRGFPTTIVMTATVHRGGSGEVLSATTQTCRVTWHVWEEAYRVEVIRPGLTQSRWIATLEGVLRRCAEARRLLAGDHTQVPESTVLFARGTIQVNPVSQEVLKKLKRWVMRPSSTGTAAPGDALFSTFTGLFLQRIGEAERDQRFFTRPATPTRFSSQREERRGS